MPTPLARVSLLALFGGLIVLAPAAATSPPTVTSAQVGDDLVVTTKVTANNSSHVLWTKVVDASGDTITLQYCVIQNTDLFVRSQKQVAVEWRLPGVKKGNQAFAVQPVFQPDSAGLKELIPQLQKLADEGERAKKNFGTKK